MVNNLIEFPVPRVDDARIGDPDLAALAARGDTDAFEQLVQRYQGLIRGMLLRLTGNAFDADDLAQSTFLKAWSKISTYSGGQFRSWICAVAYREFLQDARRQKSRLHLSEMLKRDIPEQSSSGLAGVSHDLDRAFAALPENQRVVVTLSIAAGMSHGEIAVATGWPLGTVKSHINRGKSALKELLVDYGVA